MLVAMAPLSGNHTARLGAVSESSFVKLITIQDPVKFQRRVKALGTLAMLYPGFRVGSWAIRAIQKSPKLLQALRTFSFIRRPLHQSAAWAWPHRTWITGSLKARKAWAATVLGLNMINPFQSIRYAQRRQWDRAAVNTLFPLIGIPIYDLIRVDPSSSQDLVQNGGGPAPIQIPNRAMLEKLSAGLTPSSSSAHGGGRSGAKPRRNTWERCPPGHYWDGKKCRKVGTGPNWY